MDKREAALTAAYNAAVELRDQAYEAVDALPADAADEVVAEASQTLEDAAAEVERCKANLDQHKRIAAARAASPKIDLPVEMEEVDQSEKNYAREKGSSRDAEVYTPDGKHSYFRDLAFATIQNDMGAAKRLAQHEQITKERKLAATDAALKRDVETTDFSNSGFVPPQYLADMWIPIPRGKRPFADACVKIPLPPDGLTLTIPKVTTGVSVATQVNQADAVSETDSNADVVTASVNLFAGQNDLSLTAVERTRPGFDGIVMRDLVAAYNEYLDTQLLSGTGANGQHLGIRQVTSPYTVAYTDGTPTAAELFPKLYDAIQGPLTNKVGPVTAIWAHPRRAAWLASNLSSTFPLFQVDGLYQAAGSQSNGLIMNVSGVPVRTDVNIGTTYGASTNQDEIYAVNMDEMFLAEGELRTRALPEVLSGTLQVRFQVFAYSAFIPHRLSKNISIVSGTGLVTPTF